MSFQNYLGKRARITDVDGEVFVGTIVVVTPAIDNEENEASFCINSMGLWIEFFESEIDSFEILEE